METWVGEEGRGATPVEINEHVDAIIGDAMICTRKFFQVWGLWFVV